VPDANGRTLPSHKADVVRYVAEVGSRIRGKRGMQPAKVRTNPFEKSPRTPLIPLVAPVPRQRVRTCPLEHCQDGDDGHRAAPMRLKSRREDEPRSQNTQ